MGLLLYYFFNKVVMERVLQMQRKKFYAITL